MICFMLVPVTIFLDFAFVFLEETPLDLVKKGKEQNAVNRLNKIARFNGRGNIVTLDHVLSVIE